MFIPTRLVSGLFLVFSFAAHQCFWHTAVERISSWKLLFKNSIDCVRLMKSYGLLTDAGVRGDILGVSGFLITNYASIRSKRQMLTTKTKSMILCMCMLPMRRHVAYSVYSDSCTAQKYACRSCMWSCSCLCIHTIIVVKVNSQISLQQIFSIWYEIFLMLYDVYARPIRMSCHIITMAATGLTCSVSLRSIFVLVVSVIFSIGEINGDGHAVHKRFEYKYSFKPPYLAQKDGTVPFWEYGGSKYQAFYI